MQIPTYIILQLAVIHVVLIVVVGWFVLHSGNTIQTWLDENIDYGDIYLETDVGEITSINT